MCLVHFCGSNVHRCPGALNSLLPQEGFREGELLPFVIPYKIDCWLYLNFQEQIIDKVGSTNECDSILFLDLSNVAEGSPCPKAFLMSALSWTFGSRYAPRKL
jgi:hypothetical protein